MSALPQPLPLLQRQPMSVNDVEAVAAIEACAYSHPWSRGNFIDSLGAGYIAEVLAARGERWDAGIVGYFVAMPGVGELHLLNVTVAPSWQRRGLGSALMQVVGEHARARGLATLWLEVRQGNAGARALYRRLGFAEVSLRRGYYPAAGGREDAVVMNLKVSG